MREWVRAWVRERERESVGECEHLSASMRVRASLRTCVCVCTRACAFAHASVHARGCYRETLIHHDYHVDALVSDLPVHCAHPLIDTQTQGLRAPLGRRGGTFAATHLRENTAWPSGALPNNSIAALALAHVQIS